MKPMILRSDAIAAIQEKEPWDVVVIGGGATGLGAAVDAAVRGFRTVLLEAFDFAKGTSSRTTKLVHGGVRYLAQGDIHMVQEALRERGLLKHNAPHLVKDLAFVVPAYDWWAAPYYGAGLKVYDVMAGKLGLHSTQFFRKRRMLEALPTLEPHRLIGGICYYDCQFDDARMAVTLLRTMQDLGGIGINYCPVTGLIKRGGHVQGVIAHDKENDTEYHIRARAVINATGVWVDDIRRMDDVTISPMLSISQGVHIVMDAEFVPGVHALMIPKTDDGRVLFGVPWHGKVIFGTTDTPVPWSPAEPRALNDEIEFILNTAKRYLAKAPTRDDVRSVYAGLRPLFKAEGVMSTSALSRDHVIRISDSGLLTITGGKWTTYRKMGQDVMDRAIEVAGFRNIPCKTKNLLLHGTGAEWEGIMRMYGSDAAIIAELPGSKVLLHPDLPYVEAQVRFAAREEMARNLEDVLARRTRALILNARASMETAPRVAEILSEELGKNEAWAEKEVRSYRELASGYTLPPL
ncbi:MAG: glycerol-3-phosphate dehydrogenase/oxidase [Syntrophales bacterium]